MNNPEIKDSIELLGSKLDRFADALDKASESVKLQGSEVNDRQIVELLQQVIAQNEKIARGMIQILEMMKGPSPYPQPRPQPMPPRPMYGQQQQPMYGQSMQQQRQMPPRPMYGQPMSQQEPPIQRMMQLGNLPPPPPPSSHSIAKRPKMSLSFFNK